MYFSFWLLPVAFWGPDNFVFPHVFVLQLWPGILYMKDFLPVEGLMALCYFGMLGM